MSLNLKVYVWQQFVKKIMDPNFDVPGSGNQLFTMAISSNQPTWTKQTSDKQEYEPQGSHFVVPGSGKQSLTTTTSANHQSMAYEPQWFHYVSQGSNKQTFTMWSRLPLGIIGQYGQNQQPQLHH